MLVVNVIREFFANRNEAVDNMCYVRGKWVRFDCVTINHNYKLRDFKFDEYTPFSRVCDPNEIMRVLCGPHGGVIWKERERKIINFNVSYLT